MVVIVVYSELKELFKYQQNTINSLKQSQSMKQNNLVVAELDQTINHQKKVIDQVDGCLATFQTIADNNDKLQTLTNSSSINHES